MAGLLPFSNARRGRPAAGAIAKASPAGRRPGWSSQGEEPLRPRIPPLGSCSQRASKAGLGRKASASGSSKCWAGRNGPELEPADLQCASWLHLHWSGLRPVCHRSGGRRPPPPQAAGTPLHAANLKPARTVRFQTNRPLTTSTNTPGRSCGCLRPAATNLGPARGATTRALTDLALACPRRENEPAPCAIGASLPSASQARASAAR